MLRDTFTLALYSEELMHALNRSYGPGILMATKHETIKLPRVLPKPRAPHMPTKRIKTKKEKARDNRRAWKKEEGLE